MLSTRRSPDQERLDHLIAEVSAGASEADAVEPSLTLVYLKMRALAEPARMTAAHAKDVPKNFMITRPARPTRAPAETSIQLCVGELRRLRCLPRLLPPRRSRICTRC